MNEKTIILACILFEEQLQQEWIKLIGSKAQIYTKLKLQKDELQFKNISLETSTNCEKYWYGYLEKNLEFLEHVAPRETWTKGLIALKFDSLSFIRYYGSSLLGIYLSHFLQIDLQKNNFWNRHCRLHNQSSNSPHSTYSLTDNCEEPELDEDKQRHVYEFQQTLLNLLKICKEMNTEYKPGFIYVHFKESLTISALPDLYSIFFYRLNFFLANVLLNLLKSKSKLDRLKAILSKLPITFLVTTVFYINPSMFISKCLELFIYKPSEKSYSLLQRLIATLVDLNSTKLGVEKEGLIITEERKVYINSLLSQSNIQSYSKKLQTYLKANNIEESEYAYSKLYLRLKEKLLFVDCLKGESLFFKYLGVKLPLLLNELQKAGCLSTLLKRFFEFINSLVKNIETMFDNQGKEEAVNVALEDISNDIGRFIEYFYPFLHYVAKTVGTSYELKTFKFILDIILSFFFIDGKIEKKILGIFSDFYKCLNDVDINNEPGESEGLEDFVDKVTELDRKAMNERFWPDDKPLQKLYKLFAKTNI